MKNNKMTVMLRAAIVSISLLVCAVPTSYAWWYGSGGGWGHGGWNHAGWGYGHGGGYYGRGYGGWGYTGWGWGAPGIYIAPRAVYYGTHCGWVRAHRNVNGHWIPAHRACW